MLEEISQRVGAMRKVIASLYASPPDALDCETQSEYQKERAAKALHELAFFVAAAFRGQSHINNVLTHVSGSNWGRVEDALRVIFDPGAASHDLSPLARNIVDLMCADRGVTGRILKPFYQGFLVTILGEHVASRVTARIARLSLGLDAEGSRPIAAVRAAEGRSPERANA